MKKSRIGLLGGTFDPIHRAHIEVSRAVARAVELDRVLFLPCHSPPHKNAANLSSPYHRYALVALATAPFQDFLPSSLELRRGGTSYTIDTLHDLKHRNPQAAFFMIVGMDAFLTLPTWKQFSEILKLTSIIVTTRPGYEPDATAHNLLTANEHRITLFDNRPYDISSRIIRDRVRDGQPVDELVSLQVESYIHKKRLYLEHRNA